ncbi:adenosine deaminase [Thalassotalea maritima]|uniref:adenosine deaminase n=1 Tax=Thalassotalea maritima TaxID=3242416 RepID=UPI003527F7AF
MPAKDLPLIDLHRHLDGNIRPNTIWDLAHKNGIALPADNLDALMPHITIEDKANDLLEFLKKLDWGVKVLKTLDDVKQVAYENVEDLTKAGIDYAELRFSPHYMGMTHKLNTQDVVAAIIDGVDLARKDFTVNVNLIGILSRTFGTHHCQLELDALLAHKDKLVAIDLAGDELNQPAECFVEHFKQVANANLNVTIHAGEADGPQSVWKAIEMLGAERIGHGVNSYKDPKLMAYLAKNNICLEVCLTSNYQTGTIRSIADHPIHTFINNDIKVCLNTDDPGVEGIELAHEYDMARQHLGLTDSELRQLQLNSLAAAFLSDYERKQLLHNKQTI